ncbi:MAG: hypothetical protein OHK0015_20930 [Chloroflexi bacterium OHK40]
MGEGRFTIPARIYLTAEERAKLEQLLEASDQTLDELLTGLLSAYLAAQPAPPPPLAPPDERSSELRRLRGELRRLRPKLHDPYNPPPAWLVQLAGELEAEIRRLGGE